MPMTNAIESTMMSEEWVAVGRMEEIPPLGARVVSIGAGNVAVFRTGDDAVFALADRCPHKGGPLSQGIVYGHAVACPLHGMCIDLASGCAVAPDEGRTGTYEVMVEEGLVYIKLPRVEQQA